MWSISAAELTKRFSQLTKRGNASGKTTREADASTVTESTSVAAPSTSDTSAMDTARAATRSVNLESTISAKLTPPLSSGSTVWSVSPSGYVEQGCPKITDADLLSLGPRALKLQEIAEGRGEPLEGIVRNIVMFYVNFDSPWLNASLGDLVTNYLENQVL